MPVGRYLGGEIRLTWVRMRSLTFPHWFELPWFPTLAGKALQDEFDQATTEVVNWCRDNLPADRWDRDVDGMQVRAIKAADDHTATLIRLRWC